MKKKEKKLAYKNQVIFWSKHSEKKSFYKIHKLTKLTPACLSKTVVKYSFFIR